MSPVTDALCASDPFSCLTPSLSTKPSSKDFLALSHAPPPEVMEIATNKPLTITPSSDAPKAAKADEMIREDAEWTGDDFVQQSDALARG